MRKGVASAEIAERRKAGQQLKVYLKPNTHFRLPSDPGQPVIMIGPGTGVAPFRGFLQEREATGATGRNWLFFGARNFTHDFLYQLEWQDWAKSGLLSRVDLAFSRDQREKIYVQHRMWEARRELFAWLEEGAALYVCGDAKAMAKDVQARSCSHHRRGIRPHRRGRRRVSARIAEVRALPERRILMQLNRTALEEGWSTETLLSAVVHRVFPGKIAVVSSFGAESAVLLHLVAGVDRSVPVVFLDTGKLFPETLRYRDTLVDAARARPTCAPCGLIRRCSPRLDPDGDAVAHATRASAAGTARWSRWMRRSKASRPGSQGGSGFRAASAKSWS